MNQPIEPREFLNGILLESFLVKEMFIAVDDHSELGAPVTDVVIARHRVADEPQDAADGITDDRAPQVAHVHRLGDIRPGEVDDVGLG